MAKLAWLGLGAMGTPMASRLIEAGHDVIVWNRSRSKADPFEGRAAIADTPSDAARGVDAAVTMLATPDAVDEIVLGEAGALAGLGDSGTLIDMSTVGPDYVAGLRARLPEGLELVDAPVLGSVSNAGDVIAKGVHRRQRRNLRSLEQGPGASREDDAHGPPRLGSGH